MTRPRAALVSTFVPHPSAGGPRMRAWDWLVELAEDHEVDLVLVAGDSSAPLGPCEEVASSVTHVRTTQAGTWARRLARALPVLAWWRPGLTAGWHRPDWSGDEVGRLVESCRRVVVFRLHSHLVAAGLVSHGAILDLDLDDREARTWRGLAASQWRLGRPRSALVSLLTSWQYIGAERRVVRCYDRVHVAAGEDLPRAWRARAALRPNRLTRIPVVMDPEEWSSRPARALFVGTLNYPPNEEAARWLAGPFRAEMQRRGTDCEIWIAGLAPSPGLVRALEVPGVRLFADVPDLEVLYGQVRAVVIPLRSGGGTKFKTLEAVAHGVPVVGLEQARRGLPLRDREHLVVVRRQRDFADGVAALLASPPEEVVEMTRRACERLVPVWISPVTPGRRP